MPGQPPPLADVVEMLTIVKHHRASIDPTDPAEAGWLAAADAFTDLVRTHLPDPADQNIAGVAVMLAAAVTGVSADRGVPAAVIGGTLAAAAASLIEGS